MMVCIRDQFCSLFNSHVKGEIKLSFIICTINNQLNSTAFTFCDDLTFVPSVI